MRLAHEHADERRIAALGKMRLMTTGFTKPAAPSVRAR
jgi:hypothetical protein